MSLGRPPFGATPNVLLRLPRVRLNENRADELVQAGVIGRYHRLIGVSLPVMRQLVRQRASDFGEAPFHAAINSHLPADQCAGAGRNLSIQGPGITTGNFDPGDLGWTTGSKVLTPQSCKLHRDASVSRCVVRTGALLTTTLGSTLGRSLQGGPPGAQ